MLISSGYSVDDIAEDLNDGESAGFIQKPYRTQTLKESIAALFV